MLKAILIFVIIFTIKPKFQISSKFNQTYDEGYNRKVSFILVLNNITLSTVTALIKLSGVLPKKKRMEGGVFYHLFLILSYFS